MSRKNSPKKSTNNNLVPDVEMRADDNNDRTIIIEGSQVEYAPHDEVYSGNNVITSQYTPLNFPFKNLFEQFHEVSNCYFFLIGVFQLIPQISATGNKPQMWMTLFCIMAISAIRAALEDYGKHKGDEKRNSAVYEMLQSDGTWAKVKSGRIMTGNIVKVKKNQMLPADMIFLASSFPEGHCFLDRANLNGETQLEVCLSILMTRQYFLEGDSHGPANFQARLDYETPNKKFDEFRGELTVENHLEKVCGKFLLMRETNLRNTEWIIGVVAYTGDDTKIQRSNMAGEKPRPKKSKVFRMMDGFIIKLFLAQFVLCVVGAIFSAMETAHSRNWYLMQGDVDSMGEIVKEFMLRFFTWVQVLCQMVPISLIMTAEMVKYIQGMFIMWDIALYHPELNQRAKVNRSTIHEDLGLVDYIFSDKTGTLTQNKMEFRYLSIFEAGEHGSKDTEIAKSVRRRQNELNQSLNNDDPRPSEQWTRMEGPLYATHDSHTPNVDCCSRVGSCWCLRACWEGPEPPPVEQRENVVVNSFSKEEQSALLSALWGPRPSHEDEDIFNTRRSSVHNYMVHMALSNTVKPYIKDGQLDFQAESAEELAMVKFARVMGFTLKQRSPTILEIQERDCNLQIKGTSTRTFNHLATFGFTSRRARVTLIYEEDDIVHVMCKGQDTVVLPLLAECPDKLQLEESLSALCANGLRTLVCARAQLPIKWWEENEQAYTAVTTADTSATALPGQKGSQEWVKEQQHACFQKIEKSANLAYFGLMGLEDQLQLLVPETIKDFLRARIKVWMITGDKLETARNIGLACNLIDADMQAQFGPQYNIQELMQSYHNARLIEITGNWASVGNDKAALTQLFEVFDSDQDGLLSGQELDQAFQTLKAGFELPAVMRNKNLTLDDFLKTVQKTKPTLYDAVKHDISQGWKVYDDITDHLRYPISLLINRDAFLVMFPDLAEDAGKTEIPEIKLEELREAFFGLAAVSKSVVFARAQPSMKKRMVTEIQRRQPQAITLAVGDGANDVDMICAAHLGIGIAGVEGTGAVNSADYAIGTFRMLHTLIFVHGYWSYRRIAYMAQFLCYKAFLFSVPCFLYGIHSGFSANSFYDQLNIFFYNLAYTASPVMAIAIWDQALPRDVLQNNVAAFREQKNKLFEPKTFLLWVVRAIVHGNVVYWIPFFAVRAKPLDWTGQYTEDLVNLELLVFFSMTISVTVMSLLDMASFTLIHWICIFIFSLASLVVFNLVGGAFEDFPLASTDHLYEAALLLFTRPLSWAVMTLCIGVVVMFEVLWRGLKIMLRPTLTNVLQERHLFWNKMLPLSEKDEMGWKERKPERKKETYTTAPIDFLSSDDRGDQLKAIIRVMLKFKNLTGASFESAANHQYEKHDVKLSVKEPHLLGSSSCDTASFIKSTEQSQTPRDESVLIHQ